MPRSLFSRGLRLKSSMMSAMMRCLRSPALISSSIVAQRLRSTAFWKLLRPLVFCSNHCVDGGPRGEPLRHVAGLVLEVEDHAVGHALVELVGVDVGAEYVPRHLLVLAQERRAGEADEDRALQPALHLPVHVAALRAVALVHEHVEAPVHRRRLALQVGGVELVDQRAQEARRGRAELLHELRPRGDARRGRLGADHPGVLHHPLDLLVQLVAVGDDQDARLGVVLQQPLGDQHHQDALAAALRVPDDAALAPGDAFLRRLHAEELVRPRHLLLAGVEDDEVADQVEQARLVAELRQRPVEQRPGGPAPDAADAGASSFHSTKNCSGVPVVP